MLLHDRHQRAVEDFGAWPWASTQPVILIALLRWTREQRAFAVKAFYKNLSTQLYGCSTSFPAGFQLLEVIN